MMRLLLFFPLFLAVACDTPVPRPEVLDCGDGSPCRDLGICDAGPCGVEGASDADPFDGMTPDAELDGGDADPPPLDMRVCPPLEAPQLPRDGLADLVLKKTLPAGGPVGADALLALNLDGDPEGTIELLVARGGRIEAFDADGGDWWRTPVFDARRVIGAPDLDGDGRREVVVAAGADVQVLDGLTGAIRWQLPADPLGPERVLTAVYLVYITDFDDDGLPDLYVTDVGCGGVGTGRGAVFGFGGVFGARLGVIDGPRANGRCTRWNTAVDVDGDRRRELMLTDGRGLNVFDPLSGAQLACGDLDDVDSLGILPTLSMGPGSGGWFVFLPQGVARLAWSPDHDDRCPGEHAVDSRWRSPHQAVPAGSFLEDTNDDGDLDLITSRWSAVEQVWQVVRFDGTHGALSVLASDARLLGPLRFGADAPQKMLVRVGDPQTPPRFGAIHVIDLRGESLWDEPIEDSAAVYQQRVELASTAEFAPLLQLPGLDEPRWIIVSGDDAQDTLARRLAVVGPQGVVAVRALEGEPGAIVPVCRAGPRCHPSTPLDRLVLTRGDGRVGILDGALLLRNPDPDRLDVPRPTRPVGVAEVAIAGTGAVRHIATFSTAGVLSVMNPNALEGALVWQRALGNPRRGTPGLMALDGGDLGGVLIRDPRAGDAAWSAFSVEDGDLRWRHRLEPGAHVVMRSMVSGGEGPGQWVARMDRPVPGRPLQPDPMCPADILQEPDLLAPDPMCPEVEILPRVITALDAADGTCRWRRVLRPAYPCSGPGNQALSVADGDGDGVMELYVSETNALHRLDPDSGRSTGFRLLGRGETGALRGGGWVRGTAQPPMVIWTGGNAPIEALDQTLSTRWAVPNPPGLRLQSWIGRDVVSLASGIWTVPGRGWPLHRYRLVDGQGDRRIGLLDGRVEADALATAMYANVVSLSAVDDVNGEGGAGLLVGADDGVLYGLDDDGEAVWTRPHEVAIGPPLVEQLDGVGLRELVVSAGDGRVLVYGEPGPAPPTSVWDLPCPAVRACAPGADIDESTDTTRFCGEWTPHEGVDGYEARVMGPNGAVIRDWTAFEASSAIFNGLRLVPGVRYALEVRVLAMAAGRPDRSTGRTSDGVLIVDDGAPRVRVEVSPDALVAGSVSAVITVRASDDDRLAGWHLDVIDAESDGLVVRLASAALNQPFFEDMYSWDTTDRDKRPLSPGQYRVRAEFTDRAGNTGAGEALLTLCDGPCP